MPAGRGLELDQHQIALDEILRADVVNPHDGDDLFELPADLLEHPIVADHHERHPRKLRIFGLADREAVDVVAARGEHPRDMGQHPGHVLHDSR